MGTKDLTLSIRIPAGIASALERFPLLESYVKWLVEQWNENPFHMLVETALMILIVFILFKRPSKKKSKLETLPNSVVQELIDDFQPEPLCPPVDRDAEMVLEDCVIVESRPGKLTKVRGYDKPLANFATMDFLGFGQRSEISQAASDALDKYGCGSCGPRGFYGSIDVHVYLERDLAKFFGTEEAIVYSDASSTASSAIPAFSNRADLLVVDDGCNDSILTGVNLSRSRVLFFKHNDMDDLKRVLEKVDEEDRRLKRKPQRRFIIVEGLYRNFGDIVPLDEVFKLKQKFKWRLFLDESHSIGVFGATGRGVHEHFGIPIKEIDLVISSLSTSLASVGGFCVGSREVVEHQRLSGAGYCFSASSPPFVSTAGSASIKILLEEGKQKLMPALKRNAQFFTGFLEKQAHGYLVVTSNPASALVHVRIGPEFQLAADRAEYSEETRFEEEKLVRQISRKLREHGFLVPTASYIHNPGAVKVFGSSPRPPLPPPTLRLVLTTLHDEAELMKLASAMSECAKQVLDTVDINAIKDKILKDTPTTKEDSSLKKRK